MHYGHIPELILSTPGDDLCSTTDCWGSTAGFWGSTTGCWDLTIGCWGSTTGCWGLTGCPNKKEHLILTKACTHYNS